MIGIIGGVGPYAGVQLHKSILLHTHAFRDQDHLPILHLNNAAAITDRSEYLLGYINENPSSAIISQMEILVKNGCKIIAIPCNTVHAGKIFSEIEREFKTSDVKIVNMVEEVAKVMNSGDVLLSTLGTYNSKVYEINAKKYSKSVLTPDKELQYLIHDLIYNEYGLKAFGGIKIEMQEHLERILRYLEVVKPKNVILGCTELSLTKEFFKSKNLNVIDSIDVLAKSVVSNYKQVYQNSIQDL